VSHLRDPRMPAPASESRPYFGRVESLRGLGALAVAGYHFSGCGIHGVQLLPAAPWPDADWLQNTIRQFGGVALAAHAALMTFFVISGLVLRLSLEHGPQQPLGATVRFLLGRAFRMYPIVVFAVVVTALLAANTVTAREVLANMLLLDVSLNGSWWALQVELLMAPIIVTLYFLERRCGPRVLVPIALVTSALLFKPSWAGWPPLSTNLFAFVLGMLIPTVGRRFVLGLSRRAAGMWVAGAVVALVLPNPCFGRYSKFSTLVEGYAAFALVSFVAYRQDLFALKWLDVKPFRLLGQASGSYYVLHMATVPLVLPVAAALIPAAWSATAPALVGVLVLSVWLVAFAPLAIGTYYLIEAPGVALGRRVTRLLRIGAKPAPAVVSAPVERTEPPRLAA
jgi:peptidoglycan/LPS O-acetylase OafA/YrhL